MIPASQQTYPHLLWTRGSMILQIALDTPLRRVFDYLPPGDATSAPRIGVRVRVPFGRQRLIGILVGIASETSVAPVKLKAALEFLDERPIYDPVTFDLLRWAAEYYHHPLGEVLAAALPVNLRTGQPAAASTESWQITQRGREALAHPSTRRSPRQRTLLEWLGTQSGATTAQIREFVKPAQLKALATRGWVAASSGVPAAAASVLAPLGLGQSEVTLTSDQARSVEAILASLSNFAVHLLYGVTGSGKTEVYLRVIAAAIAAGGQALVLVPEIALTPQLVDRFRRRFSAGVAVLHSGLRDIERRDAWRRAYSGEARIIIGTRSAVFTPLP